MHFQESIMSLICSFLPGSSVALVHHISKRRWDGSGLINSSVYCLHEVVIFFSWYIRSEAVDSALKWNTHLNVKLKKNYDLPVNEKRHIKYLKEKTIKTKNGLISKNMNISSCLLAPVFHMWFCFIIDNCKTARRRVTKETTSLNC